MKRLYFLMTFDALLLILVALIMGGFGEVYVDEILFYLTNGMTGGNIPATIDFFNKPYLLSVWLIVAVFLLPFLLFLFFSPPRRQSYQKTYALILAVLLSVQLCSIINLPAFLRSVIEQSDLYEQHYIAPETVRITFPEQKRNLIYIFMESMENTLFSEKQGGVMQENLMPELEKIARENINFSNKNNKLIGGGVER